MVMADSRWVVGSDGPRYKTNTHHTETPSGKFRVLCCAVFVSFVDDMLKLLLASDLNRFQIIVNILRPNFWGMCV